MKNFNVDPYVGVGDLLFGMSRRDAQQLLGLPKLSRASRYSREVTDFWQANGLQLPFESDIGGLVEVSMYSNLPEIVVGGIDLLEPNRRAAYKRLCAKDGAGKICVGITVLFGFGVALSGFDHDENQESVTAFSKGRWTEDDPDLKPLKS